ncbi:MAG TPA: Ig-like domain-containing protein [Thermoanaerobaculia bacterium]|jgi:hypothetical protein|nr:Ig-like domain-containing protein [Thermoanaerobaculia bacterium]
MSLRRSLVWLCLSFALLPWPAAAQVSPLLLRGPYLQSATPTSVVVRWRTGLPTDSRVRFGLAPDALDRQADDPRLAIDHQVTLTGLSPGTRYYYSVGSKSGGPLAGGDAGHHFVTAPVPGTRQPTRIWAFGDAGDDPQNEPQRRVRDGYLKFANGRRADVWLLLGDNAYTLANDADYQTDLFESYPAILRQTPVWPTFGNHEAFSANPETQLGAYFDIFTLPTAGQAGGVPSGTEAYYSFDHANIHFISLNTEVLDRETTGPMITWLRQDLAANSRDWTIVYFHRPVYSKRGHDSDAAMDSDGSTAMRDMRERVLPILEESGVDLVLMGHSHSYERSYLLDGHYGVSGTFDEAMKVDDGDGDPARDGAYQKTADVSVDAHAGTVYAVVGTGEENTGGPIQHPSMVHVSETRAGTLVIDVDGGRLDAVFVAEDGTPGDRFMIVKGTANLDPYAMDDRAFTGMAAAVTLAVLANDWDPNRDRLTLASVGAPAHGTAQGNADGTVTYTPAPGFAGTDSFPYTVSDGRGGTATGNAVVSVTCADQVSFDDDFEPAAGPGWRVETASNPSPLSAPWTLVSHPEAHSPGHGWLSQAGEESVLKDDRLVSPLQRLTPNSKLTFWHRFDFEQGFDGGVLEISENGGATWIDLGPYIRTSVYNGTTGANNPIGGRPAWSGTSSGMERVEVDLGAFAGEGRLVRWRLGCDETTFESHAGWLVDDVQLTAAPPGCGLETSLCGEPAFGDWFESGDLSRWSSSETDGGDLAVRGAAAIEGAFGLEATIDDHASLTVRDETPAAEPAYCARFLFDPNSVVLPRQKRLTLLRAGDGAGQPALEVFLRNGAVPGTYALSVEARRDDGTRVETGWLPVADAATRVSLGWRRASAPGASDGAVTVFLDGLPAAGLTGLDNGASGGIEAVELGAMSPKRGTAGAVRFDSFESGRSGPGN